MPAFTPRVLSVQGACNLRSLGGYRTADGRRIREGVLFRSGVLSYFAPDAHPHLEALALRTIVDLRSGEERAEEPTQWPTPVTILSWNLESSVADQQKNNGLDNPADSEHARALLTDAYRFMPQWLQPQLQGLFKCLIDDEVPLLFHCAAGKDRTGIVAAIVLHALGVPRATILDDYELTNRTVDLQSFMVEHRHARLGLSNGKHPFEGMPDDIRDAIFSADRNYLLAALAKIETDHGSLDRYLHEQLGIDQADLQRMRERLLVD